MASDVVAATAVTAPILILGAILGLRFGTGPAVIVAFVLLAALWSLSFAGFG